MPQRRRLVGLDIAKSKVDGCIRSVCDRLSAPSTPAGRELLIGWLRRHRVGTAVMEATGGYERPWAEALRQAGIIVRIVDPKRVRDFAKAAGRLAKNDTIDADTIAWFGEIFPQELAVPHDPERDALDRLLTARTAFADHEARMVAQGEHKPPPLVAKAIAAVVKVLRAQYAKLDAAIAARIAATPDWARRAQIIASVPGLGERSVAGLLAWMPELGHLSDQAAAALVGAAPYDDDSGKHKGVRRIRGGRRKLRNLLFMPVMGAATQHNPVLKAYYERLIAKGKEPKVALIACMRKLIVILNTMIARGEKWDPSRHRAAMS